MVFQQHSDVPTFIKILQCLMFQTSEDSGLASEKYDFTFGSFLSAMYIRHFSDGENAKTPNVLSVRFMWNIIRERTIIKNYFEYKNV